MAKWVNMTSARIGSCYISNANTMAANDGLACLSWRAYQHCLYFEADYPHNLIGKLIWSVVGLALTLVSLEAQPF